MHHLASLDVWVNQEEYIKHKVRSYLEHNHVPDEHSESKCYFFKLTRICASLGSRMKYKTLCYPVFGRNKNTALPSF